MTQKSGKKTKGKSKTLSTILANAHQQAPWRMQVQWIGNFLLLLMIAVLVGGVYTYITALSTEAGQRFQDNEWNKRAMQFDIAELSSQYGQLTSAGAMKERALEMGYVPADVNSAVYMVVPEYAGRQPVVVSQPMAEPPERVTIIPAYTQSLWDWLFANKLGVPGIRQEVTP